MTIVRWKQRVRQARTHLLVFAFLCVGLAGIYGAGLHAPYYGDDYQWVFEPMPENPLHFFTHAYEPAKGWYRPIQAMFLVAVQSGYGSETLPIHVTQLVIHGCFSWLIYIVILRLHFTQAQAALGALCFAFFQTSTYAVIGNDTISQQLAPLFGSIALWLLYQSYAVIIVREKILKYVSSIVLLVLSLLSKETGYAYVGLIVLTIILCNYKYYSPYCVIRRIAIQTVPFILVAGACYALRLSVVEAPTLIGEERYNFYPGTNIFANIAKFGLSMSLPWSSVDMYEALESGDLSAGAPALIATLVFLCGVIMGLIRSQQRSLMFVIGIFMVFAMFPMAGLNHVGELYTYNFMQFASILFGIGLGRVYKCCSSLNICRRLAIACIGLLFTAHISANIAKVHYVVKNGEMSERLLAQLKSQCAEIPINGRVTLINPPADRPQYSVYALDGFNCLRYGEHRIAQLCGREDITVEILQAEERINVTTDERDIILTVRDGKILRLDQAQD